MMLLWVIVASVWLSATTLTLALCRAAAGGDAALSSAEEDLDVGRQGERGRSGAAWRKRPASRFHRSGAGTFLSRCPRAQSPPAVRGR